MEDVSYCHDILHPRLLHLLVEIKAKFTCSVIAGSKRLVIIFHPHSVAWTDVLCSVFYYVIWRYTLEQCSHADSSIAGNPLVSIPLLIFQNFSIPFNKGKEQKSFAKSLLSSSQHHIPLYLIKDVIIMCNITTFITYTFFFYKQFNFLICPKIV